MSLLETLSIEYLCANNPKVKELKKLAKQYKKSPNNHQHESLQQCQDIIAKQYGFNHWQHFIQYIKSHYEMEKHSEKHLKRYYYDTPQDEQSLCLGQDVNFEKKLWLSGNTFRTHNIVFGNELYHSYDVFLIEQMIEKKVGVTWVVDNDVNIHSVIQKAQNVGLKIHMMTPGTKLNVNEFNSAHFESFVQCYLGMKKSRSIMMPNEVLNQLNYTSIALFIQSVKTLPQHIKQELRMYPDVEYILNNLANQLECSFMYQKEGYPVHTLQEFNNTDLIIVNLSQFEDPKMISLLWYYFITNAVNYTFSHSVLTSYPEIHKRRTPIPKGKNRLMAFRNAYLSTQFTLAAQLRSLGSAMLLSYPNKQQLAEKIISQVDSSISLIQYVLANATNYYYQGNEIIDIQAPYRVNPTQKAQVIVLNTSSEKPHMLNYK